LSGADTHLSQIATRWSLVLQAHGDNPAVRSHAQGELLLRYCAAVYRYLRSITRDETKAEELCQEFALRFLRGDFRHAAPDRGRFRNYLKVALVHLAGEFVSRSRSRPLPAGVDPADDSLTASDEADRRFLDLWRSELVDRTWTAMAESSAASGDQFYEVLRLKAAEPARTSASLAEELTCRHGRPVNADAVRQTLHRARARFAELLRAEVGASIPTDNADEINAELADLGLLVYLPDATAAGS
jgi:RNA polymerase sigma factor (sigma-70 family)